MAEGRSGRARLVRSRWPRPGVLLSSDCWSDLAEAYVPPQIFYNGKVDYFDLQRLGGLLSHLRKTLKGVCRPVGGGQGSS